MHNREQIKWKAFEALYKTKDVKDELRNKRNLVKMPDLSIDQYAEMEEQLLRAYTRGNIVLLTYYRYPKFYQIMDKIKRIEPSTKKLYLEKGKVINIRQVVKIEIK